MSMPRHNHQTLYAVLHSHHQSLSPGCYSESTEEIGHAGLGRRAGRWLANYFKPRGLLSFFLVTATCYPACYPACSLADVFELKGGGKLYGTLVNAEETNPKEYVIETEEGMRISLPASGIKIIKSRDIEEKYKANVAKRPDDVASNEKMVTLCIENGLLALAKAHRERVLDLDPDNRTQRSSLDYFKSERDGWILEEKYFSKMGLVRQKAEWKFPEEVVFAQAEQSYKENSAKVGKELMRAIRDAYQEGKRQAPAAQYLRELKDPLAIPKIRELFLTDKEQTIALPVQNFLVDALGRMKTPDAAAVLCEIKLRYPVEVGTRAFEEVKKFAAPFAVSYFIQALNRKENNNPNSEVINRAGEALGELESPQAIKPLIRALISRRTRIISEGGGTSASSNGSFGAGGKTVMAEDLIQNPGVLSGLRSLTDANVRDAYNQAAWNQWYAESRSRTHLDLQRDP